MGRGMQIMCMSCHYKEELLYGGGMHHVTEVRQLMDDASVAEKRRLLSFEKQGGYISKGPSYEYFECPKCQTLHSRYHYEITYNGNQKHTKINICNECRSKLLIIKEEVNEDGYVYEKEPDIQLDKYVCKKCKSKNSLGITGLTMWD